MNYLYNLDLKLIKNLLTIFNYFTYFHLFLRLPPINYYKNFNLTITISENFFTYFSGL